DSFKSLCFQYPCEYGAECSDYHLEPDNKVLYRDTEILDEASFTRQKSELSLHQPLTFQHLVGFKQTHNVEQLQGPKQKYRFGMGYAKKALDLAIRADKVEEFVSNLKNFIEVTKSDLFSTQSNASFISVKDPLHVLHKGRQPNRYKSGGEPSRKVRHIVQSTDRSNEGEIQKVTEALNSNVSTLQDSEKKSRWCHKCKQVGHYAPTCPNVE
ncbi:27529_t:CDS:2, partial [Gigaspora margarita]